MKMTLSDLEFIRLLPQFMQGDLAIQGLSLGMDIVIPQLSQSVKHLTTWDQIDTLSEEELDDLAWELNILWYEQDADISIKRDVIKNSDKVYQHLGTKWAVENVIHSYFQEGHIKEWFEYEGLPGRFSIYSTNPSITSDERLPSFLNLLSKVKRASAHLDAIWITMESEGSIHFGAVSEYASNMDIWPLVVREIESSAELWYGAGSEVGESMRVLPLAAKSIESSGEMEPAGALSYTQMTTLEIYPQGGTANG